MRLRQTRQQRILEQLADGQEVHVATLADELGVSSETIRRDLRLLQESNKLKRVHGGALPVGASPLVPLSERRIQNPSEKETIARLSLTLVTEGQSVFLGGGSTVLAVAETLAEGPPAEFLTVMPDVADALARSGRHTVHLTGGEYDPVTRCLGGEDALQPVRDRMFDLSIMGGSALDPVLGVLDNREMQYRLQRILIERARRYALVADHTKFGRGARYCTLPYSALSFLITDRRPPEAYLEPLLDANVQLLCP